MSSKGWGKREYQPRAKIDSKLSCLTMFRAPVARALNSSRLIAGTGVTVGSTGRRAVTTWIVEDVRNAKYGTGSMSLLILAALGAGSAGMACSTVSRLSQDRVEGLAIVGRGVGGS